MASNYDSFFVNYRDTEGIIKSVSDNAVVAASATDVDTTNDKILATAHPFLDNDLLLYTAGGVAITGLTDGDYYYVVNKTANDFQLSLTPGGSAIDLTGTGTGNQTFTQAVAIKARVYGDAADVAESPLFTDINGEIAAGSFAAVAAGATVNFRMEDFRGIAFSVAQITT